MLLWTVIHFTFYFFRLFSPLCLWNIFLITFFSCGAVVLVLNFVSSSLSFPASTLHFTHVFRHVTFILVLRKRALHSSDSQRLSLLSFCFVNFTHRLPSVQIPHRRPLSRLRDEPERRAAVQVLRNHLPAPPPECHAEGDPLPVPGDLRGGEAVLPSQG